MMRRRQFVSMLGGAAAWPLVARAQQPAVPVVGFLYLGTPEQGGAEVAAFRHGLSEAGYVEGQNIAIEYRFAQQGPDRLPELAADLVRRQVAVLATPGSIAAALAAKAATTTIPIVFSVGVDPIQSGLVTSLNRPGGNATGVNSMSAELDAKRLGLLHALVPGATRFAILVNPKSPMAESIIAETRAAAVALGRELDVLTASDNREIDTAFASLVQRRADALAVSADALFRIRRVQLATYTARQALPAIYSDRQYAAAGGLMSYGASIADQHRLAGIYAGRILKGEKAADLPVMRVSKFELVINLQTAKVLGLGVPPVLLATADEVIE